MTLDGALILDSCSNARDRLFGMQNLFEYVASKLPGRRITASQICLQDHMWKKGANADCLAGDNVVFQEEGSDVTAVARRGDPNCKELSPEDVAMRVDSGGSCLSRCRKTCEDAAAEWAKDGRRHAGAKLTYMRKWEGRYDPCTWGYKKVCKISAA
jgi:hypothetical protein